MARDLLPEIMLVGLFTMKSVVESQNAGYRCKMFYYEKPFSEDEPVICIDEKPVVLHQDICAPRPARLGKTARRSPCMGLPHQPRLHYHQLEVHTQTSPAEITYPIRTQGGHKP
jgi:hypothetical protein